MSSPWGKRAAFLVAFLTIGPIAVALDLAIHILPDYPAIQTMRSASLAAKSLWLISGLLGVAAVMLLCRRPVAGFVLTLMFSVGSVAGGNMLWQQPRPFTVVLAALACVLAGIGAWQALSNVASNQSDDTE
jgi:asparagine N-glycosylation enzyme membrane subunit Stt3